MPWRRRWMAAIRSSRSPVSASRRSASSAASASALQVHRAQPLALGAVALQPRLDIGELGQRRTVLEAGLGKDLRRGAVQRLGDALGDFGDALAGGDHALLGAAALLAGFGQRVEGEARDLVGLGQNRLAGGERVGGLGACAVSAAAASDSSALRFSSIAPARRQAPAVSVSVSPRRSLSVAIWSRALAARSFQVCRSTAIAARRPERISASRARLSTAARASASTARSSFTFSRWTASASASACGSAAAARPARASASAASLSARLAVSRASASSRPLRLAAMRLSSRSASASARRAASRAARAPRRASRACRSASDGFAEFGFGALQRQRARLRPSPRGSVSASSSARRLRLASLWAAARGASARHIAVPAPQVALAADQTLAGPEQGLQARPVGALDKAGERQAAAENRRCAHMSGERFDPFRQGAILGRGVDPAPARRRILVGGGVEVVAEGGTERRLEAGIDRHRIDHRRVAGRRIGGKDRGQRRRFGLELGERVFGGRQLLARMAARLARRRDVLLGRSGRRLGRAGAVLRSLHRLPPLGYRRALVAGTGERGKLAVHPVDLAAELCRALGRLA